MEQSTIWWVLAGVAVVAELTTGTFYLLMFSLGLIAAAVAAHMGLSTTVQIILATLVGGGATLAWHFLKSGKEAAAAAPAQANRDVNMDIGETVVVDNWNPDGTTTVKYRGSQWSAVAFADTPVHAGSYRIKEVIGSRLSLEAIAP